MAIFNERLRALREKSGLSQTEFAARVEMTQQQYSNYERSTAPKPELIVTFAKLLNTSCDYLCGATADPRSFDDIRREVMRAVAERDFERVKRAISGA